jgi:hypothetical protein
MEELIEEIEALADIYEEWVKKQIINYYDACIFYIKYMK